MTRQWWCWVAFKALGLFVLVISLQLCASGSSNPSFTPAESYRETPVGNKFDSFVNLSATFDAATGELIADSFPFGSDSRKFRSVFTIPNGAISIEGDYQNVMTANGTTITERSGHWYVGFTAHPHNISSKPIKKLHGDVIFLQVACQVWHYQHETIGQLLMLLESGELSRILAKKSSSTLLVSNHLTCGLPHVYGSMLTYYGLDSLLSKLTVHKMDTNSIYQAVGGNLFLTANGCYHPNLHFLQHANEVSAKSRQLLLQRDAEALGAAAPPPPARLYIDREAHYNRGIVNRAELLAGLAPFNFTLFSPASHTFTEQQETFARASLILSPSGTAFSANVVYCNPNTTILIEMFGKPIHTRTGTDVPLTTLRTV